MTYTPNIPQATDNPSQSQPQILANFQQINIQYGTGAGLVGDHVALTSSINNGKHNKVSWIDQSASPPTSGVNQVVAYASTNTGITMPYYQRDSLATVFPLAPIKAYATFNNVMANGTQNITPLDSFNINTPIVQTNPTLTSVVFTFTLTNACRTVNYAVFSNVSLPTLIFQYGITSTSVFTLSSISTFNPAVGTFRFSIFIMET